ncbi:8-oxo-dGTP diphosphatase [Marchantia polymorpha subsp. ruderalis]|uniref:Nudix hydrolase domain-containing protein n=2 Tax=Marchantia polymorpha TaxID=3197 RepID=A0A176W6P6_MARPO|nr:hypothetical protein AXG93_1617s1230 [Marchantia polymorpha subsp. ruderalis]PTQ37169.1 hypothetical protein MARPO_0059s0094 [Marchantia polymorpha]BBN14551.1 hypothetical protein Mp_6g12530 [Marchantia polymorpha subsp. ruderalis]|eukprot:PTQ37169.1 hypothetical protein MARPO_0059s0094 [Marchantia polymorpha]
MAANDLEGHSSSDPIPKVGVAVLICRDLNVLCGRRKSKVGYDSWALPGGHLEFGETFEECACREVEEETGLLIQNVRLGTVTNSVLLDDLRPAHYVTVYVKAELVDPRAQPRTLEPDRCDGWHWIEWPNVPDPIFKPLEELIAMKYDPFV